MFSAAAAAATTTATTNSWLTHFVVGNPPATYSDIFMPLITMAYLGAINQDFTLNYDLQNQLSVIINNIIGDNYLGLQIIAAIQQQIHIDQTLRDDLGRKYRNEPYDRNNHDFVLINGVLSNFGHIPGGDQEHVLEVSLLQHGQFNNVFNILEDRINRYYHPDMYYKKYLKYKNKYLQLKK
jgi:hypothetical protein